MIPYATRRVTSPSPVDATQELWGRGGLLRGDLSDEMRRMEPLDTGAFGVGLPYGLGALNWLAARLRRLRRNHEAPRECVQARWTWARSSSGRAHGGSARFTATGRTRLVLRARAASRGQRL